MESMQQSMGTDKDSSNRQCMLHCDGEGDGDGDDVYITMIKV
jgi:hypothetical protein